MPRPTASSVFQRSWPTCPGSRYAAISSASRPGARGSAMRWFTQASLAARTKKAAEAAFFLERWPGTLCRGCFGGLGRLPRVLLAELLDPACRVDDLLLARVERVARGAHLDVELLAEGRARREGVSAAADHLDFLVFGMDLFFHGIGPCRGRNYP